ncbi:MAG: response regulator, partial [Methyloceanibacter sp.]
VGMRSEEEELLKGLRVLVVEDQAPIALQLEDMLVESECQVVGPASRVGQALRLLGENVVDAAVLDLNVAGELVYPVADALDARGLPYIFATGYDPSDVSGRYGHRNIVQKPFSRRVFLEAFRATVRQN